MNQFQLPSNQALSARGALNICTKKNVSNYHEDHSFITKNVQSPTATGLDQSSIQIIMNHSIPNYYTLAKGETTIKMNPILYKSPERFIQTTKGIQKINGQQQIIYLPRIEIPILQQPIQVVDLKQYDELQQTKIKELEDQLKLQKLFLKDDSDQDKLNCQVSYQNQQISQLEENLEKSQQENENLNIMLESRKDQIQQLYEKLQQVEQQLEDKNNQLLDWEKTNKQLKNTIQELSHNSNLTEYWKQKFRECSDQLHKCQEDFQDFQTEQEVKSKTIVKEMVVHH